MGRKIVAVGDAEHTVMQALAKVLGKTSRRLTEEMVCAGVRDVLAEDENLMQVVSRVVPEARETLGLTDGSGSA